MIETPSATNRGVHGEPVLHHEDAQRVLGLIRTRRGSLVLTASHIVFNDVDMQTIVPLLDIAWIDMSRRSKHPVLELTTRSAQVLRFRVADPSWVRRISASRSAAIDTALASEMPLAAAGS
jgi:hypothetical protein